MGMFSLSKRHMFILDRYGLGSSLRIAWVFGTDMLSSQHRGELLNLLASAIRRKEMFVRREQVGLLSNYETP
jgi:hypothetical protein